MTDAAYQGKEWLNELITLFEDAEKAARAVEFVESKLNSGVTNYDRAGGARADTSDRQRNREELLITYSEKCAEYERKQAKYNRQRLITKHVINRLEDPIKGEILQLRYIERIPWQEIVKVYKGMLSKATIMRYHAAALEELAGLIKTEEPRAIEAAERQIKAQAKQATA